LSGIRAFHDSHSAFYRSPFGAVPCESTIRLRLTVEVPAPLEQCQLRLWEEKAGREVLLPMEPAESQNTGDFIRQVFVADYQAPKKPGLVWYYFRLDTGDALLYYGNNQAGLGGEGALYHHEPPGYQITVFLPRQVPAWLKEGVMYQIFVDRFCRDEQYLREAGIKRLAQQQGLLHVNWYDTPFYIKDAAGRVTRWTFFGGNLPGITAKLDYLRELGVTILYLNPIFESASNHKYDTGDYLKIDPLYGNEALFEELVREADLRGIKIILDGVFSHTGADSIYFNKYGNYSSVGAFQSPDSPYYSWYIFKQYPTEYESWWGIDVLPNVNEMEPSYRDFIYGGENSVIRHWMKKGVKGWRLDVADELPDEFIKELRQAVLAQDQEAVLIGEVWEDASNKISYGKRREYLWGEELDAVTNYPLREIWLDFFLGKVDAAGCHRRIMSLYENYPRENFYAAMNLISSHDRMRVLTVLGEAPVEDSLTEAEREKFCLPPEKRNLALRRLKLLSLMQMTFPGVPCIYYGDEAGMEGYSDPYNRGTYPWGREDRELLDWYKRVVKLRREYQVLSEGEFQSFYQGEDIYGFRRTGSAEEIIVLVNRHTAQEQRVLLSLPSWFEGQAERVLALELLGGTILEVGKSPIELTLPPLSAKVVYFRKSKDCAKRGCSLPRAAGVLLPVTALPSPWGIGDLGENAYQFIDLLQAAGQRVWQILPLNPVGDSNSPYHSPGVFAGNPLLINLEQLVEEGLLLPEEIEPVRAEMTWAKEIGRVNYSLASASKEKLLRQAFTRWRKNTAQGICKSNSELYLRYQSFRQAQAHWLEDYCLFMALKQEFGDVPWYLWDEDLAQRQPETLAYFRRELQEEIAYQEFLQYLFSYQWGKLKAYASQKGIILFGDLPIYVAPDSCDTWAYRELFYLDTRGKPEKVAGVPPDYFSATGQLWGNPLYNWEQAEKEGFAWWVQRFRRALEFVDYLRLDHFRGFEAYWELPASARSAGEGRWMKGPGKRFFEALEETLGNLPLVAEDLGFITPEVENLKHIFQLPGMKVYQFSYNEMFASEEKHVVYYTGTHDNDTLWSWGWENNFPGIRETSKIEEITPQEYCASIIEQLYFTPAAWVIVPVQDILGLGREARMNVPGTTNGNWEWQLDWKQVTPEVIRWLRQLALASGRLKD
jgi:4-alpha-glucanotransferase